MSTIKPVTSAADWDAFKQVPFEVYRDDPLWLADETTDIDAMLIDPAPGIRAQADTQAFVAYDGSTPVGRVVAIANHRYRARHDDPAAFFGFFESVARDEVAFALLDAAAGWARDRALTSLYGPVNLSVSHSAGLLVTGGGQPALIGMPYNPAYYADQLTRWGMTKLKDLHSYLLPKPRSRVQQPDRPVPLAWQPPAGLTFRTMDARRYDQEIETIRVIYNAAFGDFWGFTPVDRDEFTMLAAGFRPVLDPELVVFAEVDDAPVGYLMAIPDANQSGPHVRVDMLAVHPEHQHSWVGGLLIFDLLRRVYRKGYAAAEAAPILEDANWPRTLRRNLTLTRVYRVFGRRLDRATTPR